jgi:hypothetical protein
MDGLINNIVQAFTPLPTTKNGYTFQHWSEYKEAQYMVKDKTFKSLEEYADFVNMPNISSKKK